MSEQATISKAAEPERRTGGTVTFKKSRFYPVDIDRKRIYDDPQAKVADCTYSTRYHRMGTTGIKGDRLNTFDCYREFEVVDPKTIFEIAHTPGPWLARDYRNKEGGIWIDCDSWHNPATASCRGGTLATAHDRGAGEGTVEANAILIAAAPELLAAARGILHSLHEAIDRSAAEGSPVPVFDGIAALHDAVNKATTRLA